MRICVNGTDSTRVDVCIFPDRADQERAKVSVARDMDEPIIRNELRIFPLLLGKPICRGCAAEISLGYLSY